MIGARPMMIKRSLFGTVKHQAGMHHFLMRGLKKYQGEFCLMAVYYNLTGVLNMIRYGNV
jgi:hypothetical protein